LVLLDIVERGVASGGEGEERKRSAEVERWG
jgi:hypothetical protein